jgi:hypothetical protein
MHTTLNKIRENHPCEDGWIKLLKHLGKTKADDDVVLLSTVLESNGLDDALWCLRAVDGYEKEIRKLACDYALTVAHLWDMPDIVRQYLTTQDEKIRDAARAAAWAARAAAWDAAWAAAWAARDAAWAAAWDAAWAAGDAAGDAARAAQTRMFKEFLERVE